MEERKGKAALSMGTCHVTSQRCLSNLLKSSTATRHNSAFEFQNRLLQLPSQMNPLRSRSRWSQKWLKKKARASYDHLLLLPHQKHLKPLNLDGFRPLFSVGSPLPPIISSPPKNVFSL